MAKTLKDCKYGDRITKRGYQNPLTYIAPSSTAAGYTILQDKDGGVWSFQDTYLTPVPDTITLTLDRADVVALAIGQVTNSARYAANEALSDQ